MNHQSLGAPAWINVAHYPHYGRPFAELTTDISADRPGAYP